MVSIDEIRKAQKAEGPATIMAIGAATPQNCVDQSTYPDYYFRVTNSEHMTELKENQSPKAKDKMVKDSRISFSVFRQKKNQDTATTSLSKEKKKDTATSFYNETKVLSDIYLDFDQIRFRFRFRFGYIS